MHLYGRDEGKRHCLKAAYYLLDQPKFPVLTRPNASITRLAGYPMTSDRQRIPDTSMAGLIC
jgi:hypothetical protein